MARRRVASTALDDEPPTLSSTAGVDPAAAGSRRPGRVVQPRSSSAAEEDLLRPVLEMAVVVARQGETDSPRVPAPAGLRPYLTFSRLPTKSLAAARRVLEEDEEFRSRVVARFRPGELDLAADSWLRRPTGWERVFDAALHNAANQAAAEADVRAETDAQRRALRLEAHLAEITERLDVALTRVEELEATAAAGERSAAELERSQTRIETLESEVRRAIRDLKRTEQLLADRVAEVKALRAQPRAEPPPSGEDLPAQQGPSEPMPSPHPSASGQQTPTTEQATMGGPESLEEGRLNTDQIEVLVSLARSVAEASGAAAALGAHLGVSAELLATLIPEGRAPAEHGDRSAETVGADRGHDLTATSAGAAGATSPAGASPGRESSVFSALVPGAGQDLRTHETRPPGNPAEGRGGGARRVPLRPRRGLVAGTPAAVEDLLSTPGVIVLVDGYNASIAIWPQLALPNQREALLSAMERIHARTGAEIRIIYDGNDRGGPTTVAVPLRVRVEFTPHGEEADDRIIGLAERLPQSRPLVVVSADRRVQAGVRKFGATLLAPAQLREYLNP